MNRVLCKRSLHLAGASLQKYELGAISYCNALSGGSQVLCGRSSEMKFIFRGSRSICFKGLHQVKVDWSAAAGGILVFNLIVPEISFVTPGT